MAKLYSVLAGGLLSLLALGLQPAAGQTRQAPPKRVCATEEVNAQIQAELKRRIPGYDPTRSTSQQRPATTLRTGATTYTLPVIVHVIHNGEAVGVGTNISQAQVQSQLDVLNEDYRNTNADGALVPAVYQSRRGDMQIQFTPAKFDPNGNLLAEPGIDRVNRNTKGFTAPPYGGTTSPVTTYIDNTIKPQTYWDPSRYINIWVMDLNGGGLLGYAQFPDNTAGLGGLNAIGGLASTDGVVIKHSAYGSRLKNPTGTYVTGFDRGRTLTHELGHWFSLRHIWGDAACGNDYCADTPTQQTANTGCVTFPQITCSNVTGDMSMNYMDYSDDACLYLFTQAQKDRMQAIMAVNTPRRAELVNSTVGCPGLVAATAANSGAACVGSTVTLTATGPAGATYAWTGPNGFTSTQQNPTLTNVTTAMAGSYTVQVSVTTGACTNFASTTVTVNAAPAVPVITASPSTVCAGSSATLSVPGLLINENFNGTATGWTLANNGGAASTAWQYRTAPFTYSTYLTNYSIDGTRFVLANSDIGGSGSQTNTTLTSPVFNTTGYSTLQLTFQQFLRYITGDVAAVEVSTNGGTTWTSVATYTSTQGSATAAATTTVNLNAYINQATVQVRWRYATVWAWYWAVDNVKIGAASTPSPTYAWTLVSGNGLPTVTNTSSITVTPTQNSVYRLTVGDSGYSCTSSSTVNVNVYPAPVLATSISSVCAGGSAVLSVTNASALTPTPTYSWTVVSGDGLPAVTNTPTITVTPTQASVYRLTLTFPGATCTTTSTISVGFGQPVWTGATGNGNWFDAGNWTGCVPTRTTDATIPAGLTTPYPTIGTGVAEVRNLTQQGTLTMTGGELDLYGDHTGTGALTLNAGIVATRGTVAQALRGATYQTLLVAGSGTKTIPASTVNQALTMSGAILNTGTAIVTLAPAATITETNTTYVVGKVQTTHTVGTSIDTFGGLGLVLAPATAPGVTTVVRTTGQAQGTTNQSISRYFDISAAVSRSLQGITLSQSYFDHELNGLTKDRLVMYKSVDNGATWSSEGATSRNSTTNIVTRSAVADLQGRWTLGSLSSVLNPAAVQYAITPLPVPFNSEGLTLQVTTPDAGQLSVKLYDVLGRVIYDHVVGNLEVGTSTIMLPGSGQLQPGKYILLAKKGYLEIRVNVVRGE